MGGLDFSQGSILGISSIVICLLSPHGIGIAILGGIVAGAVIGAILGLVVVVLRVTPLIATFGMNAVVTGLVVAYAGGSSTAATPTFTS